MIIGGIQFTFSLITPNLVDKVGRRCMLLISAIRMLIANFNLGLYFFLKEKKIDITNLHWIPGLCLTVYMISYIMGFGPLPWTIMGEIFPSSMKGPASSITVFMCWTFAFLISKFFIL